MSFSGFSEDDIRKIAKGHDVNKQKGKHFTHNLKTSLLIVNLFI